MQNKICALTGRISFVMYSTSTARVPYIKIRKWVQTTKFVTHFVEVILKTTRLKLTTGFMIVFTRWTTCLKHFCSGKYLANYGRIWLQMRTGSHIVFWKIFLLFSPIWTFVQKILIKAHNTKCSRKTVLWLEFLLAYRRRNMTRFNRSLYFGGLNFMYLVFKNSALFVQKTH